MSERQETIADIVAEKRTQADRIERVAAAKMASGKITSDHFAREVVATLRTEAARLEAAAKRESNNAAAMREALEAYVEYSKLALQMGMFTHDRLVAISTKARAALAAPPRNCDVGTAKEQAIRFDKFCQVCEKCPLNEKRLNIRLVQCEFLWAQMPYESEKGAGR